MLAVTMLATTLALPAGGPAPVGAEVCDPVAYRVEAVAAPQANELVQGTEILIPLAYSRVEHETFPQFVYAEAGSTSLGPLEQTPLQPAQVPGLLLGLLPVALPIELPELPELDGAPSTGEPPGRAVSGFPAESLPAVDRNTWATGTSHTEAGATRGFASAATAPGTGGSSEVESVLDCQTLVVDARWVVRALELPGGVALGELSQTVRVELGPDGEPQVDVDTVVLDEALGLGSILGQVPDDALSAFFAAGGQRFDVQDPVIEVEGDRVHVLAHPLVMTFDNPGGPQSIEVRVGYVEVTVERLGAVPSLPPVDDGAFGGGPDAAVDIPALPGDPVATAPAPTTSATGAAMVEARSRGEVVDFVAATGSAWWPVPLATLLLVMAWWRLALARRDRWPTADYALGVLEDRGRRFRSTYLRW